MKLDTLEDGTIVLREVFNSVVLETEEGNRLAVCMRDAGFEIGVGDSVDKDQYTWYAAGNGCVDPLGSSTTGHVERKSSKEFAASIAGMVIPVPEDFVVPELPALGSRWEIDSVYDPSLGPRNTYTVLFITNLENLSIKYPPQVVYRGDNGRVWSRPLGQWPGSLRRLPEAVEEVERPFSQEDQQELDACAEAAISYGRENPVRVADGCDPAFMAALARGDHLRGIGLSEEQIRKVQEISRRFPFSGSKEQCCRDYPRCACNNQTGEG